MAIRIRKVNGVLIALCAARSVPKEGDVYLNDGEHYALAEKFWRDYPEVKIKADPEIERLVEQEESNNKNREWWNSVYGRARD